MEKGERESGNRGRQFRIREIRRKKEEQGLHTVVCSSRMAVLGKKLYLMGQVVCINGSGSMKVRN